MLQVDLSAKILSATPKNLLQKVMNHQEEYRNDRKFSVTHSIFTNDQSKILKLFLSKGFDVNRKLSTGQRPLEIVAQKNKYKLARLLLENGADPNLADEDNIMPLLTAAINQNHEIAKLLIEKVLM